MIVALNAGHCMKTAGKQAPDGYKEYNFNIAVVKKIAKILSRHGIKVVICNPDDPNKEYSFTKIASIANEAKADIFVSVHFNAMGNTWSKVRGLETYYYRTGKDLAECIQQFLLKGQPMPNRGVKQASFTVLVKTNMPAALCECGFMDNKVDRALMESDSYRTECAIEISQGILKYLGVKYIPEGTEDSWKLILRKVSAWADSVWIPFVEEHPEVNLKGLITKLYRGG